MQATHPDCGPDSEWTFQSLEEYMERPSAKLEYAVAIIKEFDESPNFGGWRIHEYPVDGVSLEDQLSREDVSITLEYFDAYLDIWHPADDLELPDENGIYEDVVPPERPSQHDYGEYSSEPFVTS